MFHSRFTLALMLLMPGAAASTLAQAGCTEDGFEPNDTCLTATTVVPGSYAGLTAVVPNLDFFSVDVPAGERVTFTVTTSGVGYLNLFLGGTPESCSLAQALDTEVVEQPSVRVFQWANLTTGTQSVVLGVRPAGTCLDYDFDVVLGPDQCAGVFDNGITGNNDCALAATVGVGSYPNQLVFTGVADFYRVSVQPAELITIDLVSQLAQGRTVWAEVDPGCNLPPLAHSAPLDFYNGSYRLQLFNQSALPQTYTVRVHLLPDMPEPLGFCRNYDMTISSTINPHNIWGGDMFEPNDSCIAAPDVPDGEYSLTQYQLNQDWYSATVEPGATLSYRLENPANGPVSSFLYSDCSLQYLANAIPTFDGQPGIATNWTNTSSAAMDVKFWVKSSDPGFAFATTYPLDLRNTQGEVFCSSAPNSTGGAARIDSSGSTDVNSGAFELSAVNIPAQTYGLFFFSQGEVAGTPFGNGTRCLAGPFYRLPVVNSGPTGVLATTIDWSNPGVAAAISSGSTWRFQAWFRDAQAGGAQFDLSDGLRVQF